MHHLVDFLILAIFTIYAIALEIGIALLIHSYRKNRRIVNSNHFILKRRR